MTHVQTFWSVRDILDNNPTMDRKALMAVKLWLKETPSLPSFINDEQIVLFLHSCSGDIEETKNCILNYYRLRGETPQFFEERDVLSPNLKKALNVLYYGILPVKTPEGCQIVFHMLKDTKPSNYVFNDGFKLLMMLIDGINAREGPQNGLIMLFDMKGVKLSHVIKLPIYSVRKSLEYIQARITKAPDRLADAIPVKLKSIHVVNVHSLIDKIMLLVKPFLRKKFLELLHFHKENDEEIYKTIPKRCMPENYGGELESIEYYHEKFVTEMEHLRPLFVTESTMFNSEFKDIKTVKEQNSLDTLGDLL
ncbi:hypothetical protein RUM43_010194 [Polyplax serrata]|uniref:CRAL-TRIO domain-containing protein n=1 Tax=Polyplax serrata TaxID=468196 RepID=A0AAN8Q4F5_POLSC